MPSLRDALPVLSGRLSASSSESGPSRFEAVVAFAASGVFSPGRGDRFAAALERAGLLSPDALATASVEEVVDALREARIEANPKVVRLLQRLAEWYRAHQDELEFVPEPGEEPPPFPAEALAAIRGVGRSTADGIALHVFGRPAYPLDRASYRILVRHGWVDVTADYDEAAQVVVAAAENDPDALVRFSLGFADLGKRFCKPGTPRCEPCPLKHLLPDGGPIEAEG